jgi:hypothetical protein
VSAPSATRRLSLPELGERAERGSMLVEMVVTILLLGIVMATVYTGISTLTGAAEGTNVRLQNLDESRLIMAATTKDIRTATTPTASAAAFLTAKPDEIRFYANVNNSGAAASIVRLYVNANTELVEEYTPATKADGSACTQQPCVYDPADTAVRFVGRYVVNDDDTPAAERLFTYLDVNGTVLSPVDPDVGLDADQALQVRSVRVQLAVSKTQAFNATVTWMQNTVGLPNVAFQQAT